VVTGSTTLMLKEKMEMLGKILELKMYQEIDWIGTILTPKDMMDYKTIKKVGLPLLYKIIEASITQFLLCGTIDTIGFQTNQNKIFMLRLNQ
jgi:hypothetical protein